MPVADVFQRIFVNFQDRAFDQRRSRVRKGNMRSEDKVVCTALLHEDFHIPVDFGKGEIQIPRFIAQVLSLPEGTTGHAAQVGDCDGSFRDSREQVGNGGDIYNIAGIYPVALAPHLPDGGE